jgi:hypothetical protein
MEDPANRKRRQVAALQKSRQTDPGMKEAGSKLISGRAQTRPYKAAIIVQGPRV